MFSFFQPRSDRDRSAGGHATKIGRLLAAKDFKALSDYVERDWNGFAAELSQYRDFLDLLTPELLKYWAREYCFTDRLGDLHGAFAEFAESGTFVYRENRCEVREILSRRVLERAGAAVIEERKDIPL